MIQSKRKKQGLDWMWQLIHEGLKEKLLAQVSAEEFQKIESDVLSQKLTAPQAALVLLNKC
jgi:hypothetical protein